MRRAVAALSLAAASLIGFGVAPAFADEADCAESGYLRGGSYEAFDIPDRFVPPPMRGTGWDCAIKVAARDIDETLLPDGRYQQSVQYMLLYVDMTFDELVDLHRRWEASGYADGRQINLIGDTAGQRGTAIGADELVALDPRPGLVNARFSNGPGVPPPATVGSNIYELVWTDGAGFQSRSGIQGRPQLLASIILTEPIGRGTGLDDPSTLSDLRTIAEAAPTPAQWGVIAGGSVMLMLVVGWPSALLNSVVGSR